MATFTVTPTDTTFTVQVGENTLAAANSATAAEGFADDAAESAASAEAFAGPSYASAAAGIAGTSDGEFFAVNASGIVTIYLNDGGSAVAQRTIATTAALSASTGAALIGKTGGGTVQDFIDVVGDAPLSIAAVCERGTSGVISAANSAAVESLLASAVTQNRSIYIPAGDWYIDAGIECLTGLVPIICDGTVYTNTTGAFITFRTPLVSGQTDNWFIRGGTFYNLNGTQSQKESSVIRFESAGALILYPEMRYVKSYGFYQTFDDHSGTYTTPFGQESRMNHGIIAGCVPNYYGALNAKYCFRRRAGSGTGWYYQSCRENLAVGTSPTGTDPVEDELLGYPAYVRIESGGINAVCGDVTIDGHFSGLQSGALSVDGACSYRTNLALTSASQIDAQARRAIFFDPQPSSPNIFLTYDAANIGGNIDIAADSFRVGGHKFKAQGYGESYGGGYLESLATGAQSITLCSVQMQADYSCSVELEVSGVVQGVAAGMRRKVYSVRHDGATVTASVQPELGFTDPSSPGAGFFDFSSSVVGDTVTFSITYTAGAANSKITANYRVLNGVVLVRRLLP